MPGELWRSVVQIGKETTAGTSVAATRKLYTREPVLTRERAPRPHRFATGTRDNVRAFTLGPEVVGGSLAMAMSADEIIELLLLSIQGAVTPTQPDSVGNPTVYLWTFKPGNTLDSATVEWDDGARPWEAAGVRVNSLTIEGNVREENVISAELFGTALVQAALTGALAERVPTFLEGYEVKLYIDSFGGTPGTTEVPGTLINWSVSLNNNLTRKYTASNTQAASAIPIGELGVEATLTFEAEKAAALTEFNNWNAATRRLVRLEFGQNATISGTYKRFVTVDIPGAWGAVNLGGADEGTRVYELSYQYVYDSTLAAGIQVRAQNTRSAAY